MNEFLFDTPSESQQPDKTPPLSHRGDPETSQEAAERLRESGRLGAQQEAVLAALRECNGATHAELGRVMGCDWLVAARRLPELERAGLVRKGEPRICQVKGSRCTTWWINRTQEGPESAASMRSGRLESTNGAGGRG